MTKIKKNVKTFLHLCTKVHREAEKRNQFSLVCIFLMLDRNWRFFSIYIKESISYNYVYLILACVKNFFVNNEIETVNTSR